MAERVLGSTKKPATKRENRPSQTQKTGPFQSFSSPVEQILFFQRTIGNQAVRRLIKSGVLQAKFRIGHPGDIYEQEADSVADSVMRVPEPQVQRPMEEEEELIQTKPVIEQITPLVQKQVEDEEELQSKPGSGISNVNPGLESQIQSIKGGGQRLSENDRTFFEPHFGCDFSQVRMHANNQA